MKQKKSKQRISTENTAQSMGSLGALFQQAGLAPSSTESETASPDLPQEPPSSAAEPLAPSDLRRARFRREKKGRGGKTVTLVEGLSLDDTQLTALLKRLKAALGCGGNVDENTLVLQGDIVDRVRKWFETAQHR